VYKILFVGLVCLFRQDGGRIALLPDASSDPVKHVARIAIDSPGNIVQASSNWPASAKATGDFLLTEACTIQFEDADVADPAHPLQTAKLPLGMRPGFEIDPAAPNAIAQVPIMRGTLTALLYPGSDKGNPAASVITQVDVPHRGNIHVKVTSRNGTVRTIELKPNTEIAVVNDVDMRTRRQLAEVGGLDHFHIYQRLGKAESVNVGTTPPTPLGYQVSQSRHRVFAGAAGVVDGIRCPNTGCCP